MIEIAFELGINLVETLIIIDFVTRYLGCKYQGRLKTIGFVSAWAAYFIELSIINYILPFEGFASFIPIVIVFAYEAVFLEGVLLLKVWISALIQIIVTIIADGTNLIVCHFLRYDPYDMLTVFNMTRVISVIITKLILFYFSRIILRHKYKNPIDTRAWFMLILIPFISITSLSALMIAVIDHNEISGYILCGMSGILLANLITYYFFSTLNRDYESKLRIKLLEQNNENAVKNLENAEAFIRQMRSVRHDMQNHLLIISGLIDNENYIQAKSYIKNLTTDWLPDIQSLINSENDAFNAIVNAKIAVCNQKKIYIEVKEMKDSLKDLNPIDTGIIFGNLLDNAIEAAEKTQSRRITVDIQSKGGYLSILVANSIDESVIEKNRELKTTKENKMLHGIGINTVNDLVKKYDSLMQFYEEPGEFCCHIMLDVNKIQQYK